MSEELQDTVGKIVAVARDKYTVHECNECTWRKCCELKFDSAKCREEREDIFLSLGIEDGYFSDLLNRIEAAWKREQDAHIREELDYGALCAAEAAERVSAPGNAAAMREALIALRDAARNFYHQILNSKYNDIMDEYKCRERGFPALLDLRYAIPKANIALAAPARNCDAMSRSTCTKRFSAIYEGNRDGLCDVQTEREKNIHLYYIKFNKWLFATAEKGGAQ